MFYSLNYFSLKIIRFAHYLFISTTEKSGFTYDISYSEYNDKKKITKDFYSICFARSSTNESSDFEYLHPKHRILT
jgi:hypothetical protein